MFPAQSTLDQQTNYAGSGHTVRWGQLKAAPAGGNLSLSKILTAPSHLLSPSIVGKLNVLRGLDAAMHIGHNRGGILGNFADTNGAGRLGLTDRPTIDQIMAWSPSVYANTSGLKMRSMAYGPSWGYSNPQAQSGSVQRVSGNLSSQDLFDRIFVPDGTPKPAQRAPIVDRVIENYRRLRNGDKRLSVDDRRRLDGHMALLAETQARLVSGGPLATCGSHMRPTQNHKDFGGDLARFAGLLHDVFAVAFACGSSRIATLSLFPFRAAGGGNWHQDVAHQWFSSGPQDWLVKHYTSVFQNAFLDFANKLNAIESGPGRTLLDDALLVWTQEAGMETHWQVSIPVITAGSAGGALKTGYFVDYRNLASPHKYFVNEVPTGADDKSRMHGLLYNQFLATALQAMGVRPSEFERWGHKGYGQPGFGTVQNEYPHASTRAYYQGETGKLFQIASEPLPVIAG